MKLEEAIHQTKYKSEYHKLILNLIYTSGLLTASQTRFFKQYDISPQQYNVLRILRGQYPNPASIGLVQERMLDQMSNASRLVEKLKLKKLLTRKECKQDRRQVDVVITEAGLKLLEELDVTIVQLEEKSNVISDEEAAAVNSVLDKLNSLSDFSVTSNQNKPNN